MVFVKSIKLGGFLSFPPDSPEIELTPLNVLIGPNGSGKSNLIEAFEVLRATTTSLASLIRAGGSAQEWIWKGEPFEAKASIQARMNFLESRESFSELSYNLSFCAISLNLEVLDEEIERKESSRKTAQSHYLLRRKADTYTALRREPRQRSEIKGARLNNDESILSQVKDPSAHVELNWLSSEFSQIQMFRDWTFGHSAPLRRPQRGDLPVDELLSNSDNLGLLLNELQHHTGNVRFNQIMTRFLPRYERVSTRIFGGVIQLFLHERGFQTPIPATRLSDGTIRFMAMLALLLSPEPPPLLCIEEPELGLHPDAVSLLAELFVEASERMQLILTTHWDALVSALTEQAASVLVCENRGGTIIERVDPSRLKPWLDKYRLGEIWRIGELGGNP